MPARTTRNRYDNLICFDRKTAMPTTFSPVHFADDGHEPNMDYGILFIRRRPHVVDVQYPRLHPVPQPFLVPYPPGGARASYLWRAVAPRLKWGVALPKEPRRPRTITVTRSRQRLGQGLVPLESCRILFPGSARASPVELQKPTIFTWILFRQRCGKDSLPL